MCLGLARRQESRMARGTQRRSRVAARVPPPLPGLSPAPDCLQEADGGTEEEAEGGDQSAEGGPRRVRRGVSPTGRGDSRAARAGARCGRSAAGMNGRARQGALGAPWRQHPVPPARPARRPAPRGLRSGARPASALNLEELGRKARAGGSGWLGRPRVRYCSFAGSRSPSAGPGVQARHSRPGSATPCPLPVLVLFPPQL